ncbi:acyl--CoA ligase [Candidatus Kaiserbacteria bacterium]|nr:acyl--CoA ligase [Candidatus Kaiserbacteria bacterium]
MMNVCERIRELARLDSERTAIAVCDANGVITEEISRGSLLKKVEEAGAHLCGLGLRAGDKVALDIGNCAELLILSWAAWGNGIVTVPLDKKRDTEELRGYKILISGAKLVLNEKERVAAPEAATAPRMLGDEHDSLILFTSGTTAHPKGAQLTLKNLLTNADGVQKWLSIAENDRFLIQLPLHHINSTTFCLASLVAGASIAIPPVYSNSRFFMQAANSGATFTSVVPSIIFDQLNRTKEFETVKDRLKLSRIQLGSAPVVVSDALQFMRKFSIPLYQGYGQTETALRVTGVPTDLPQALYERVVEENSIGEPMPWAQIEVADADGKILGEKQEGELIVKGPAVMRGYVGGEPAFRNGYFLTGDIGYWKKIEGKRFFFLIGRSKEIIIKGGANVSPVAVENALKKIDGDIEQSYAIGVKNERYGEEVGAAIVWKNVADAESALRKLKLLLLRGSEILSAYETPQHFVAVSAKDLPMTSTGKIQRSALKKKLSGAFGRLEDLFVSADFKFKIISFHSPLFAASHELYNHCWQPLTKNENEYKKYLSEYMTLGAIDKNGALAGQISFSYAGKKITCVSICSASFKPKSVPKIAEMPSPEFVRRYLLNGDDPVMNFHKKLGAELVEVIPNGRPEDKSSFGYTMLLHYPPTEDIVLVGQVSNQLIQAVRILAHDISANVYAISRPGGLASYLSSHSISRV